MNTHTNEQGVTFVLTSCGRYDLLHKTLASFLRFNTYPIEKYIIIEDSGDYSVTQTVNNLLPESDKVECLVNETRLGQLASIDKAYDQVKTPYIFHCEDDWEFTRSGFIEESLQLLETFPDVVQVHIRKQSDEPALAKFLKAPPKKQADVSYFDINPAWHPDYFGFSLNPGLRRLSDYKEKMSPYSENGPELRLSLLAKSLGFKMVVLADGVIHHIGPDRHVDDPFTKKRPKTLTGRWQHSISKRINRLKRKLTGKF